MRSRRSLGVVVLLALVAACLIKPKHAPPMRFELPASFEGWVFIDYLVPGAPPLPKEGDTLVVRIPDSGRVQTSSAGGNGIRHDTYVLIASDGQRTVLERGTGPGPFPAVAFAELMHDHTRKRADGTNRSLVSFYVGRGPVPPRPEPQ